MTWSAAKQQLGTGAWISVNQIAQVLLGGTDLVVIGKLLGPEAVVPYACTGKLLMMLANQPQMFMQMALPALSELRTAASREHLFDVARSMAQVMLLLSGAIVTVVLAVNAPFVVWWVGDSRFAGMGLTALLLLSMLMRHMNSTLVYTLFCFGHERRLAVTSVADGVVGLIVMLILVPLLGLHGAVLGSLTSLALVSLPANLRALAREEGGSPVTFLEPLRPWLVRFVPTVMAIAALTFVWRPSGLWAFAPLALAVSVLYAVVMVPVMTTPPLGPMLSARLPAAGCHGCRSLPVTSPSQQVLSPDERRSHRAGAIRVRRCRRRRRTICLRAGAAHGGRVPTTLVGFGEGRREDWHGALRVRHDWRPWHVRGQRTNPFSLACSARCGRPTSCTAISTTCW